MRKIDGFTFIEAIMVIFVLAVIAGIATPSVLAWRSAAKLKGAADNLKGVMELAKLKAIQENEMVAINFKANKYMVFKDNGATQGVHDPSEDLYASRTLPAGVTIDIARTTFADDGFGGQYTRFSGKGTANDGTAYLVNSRGDEKRLIINVLGRVRIESDKAS